MTEPKSEKDHAPFSDFTEAFALGRYRPAPEDWFVAVSDVVNSTEAIAAGRYKDVNMAGAATIACVLNVCGNDDLPFAFGGDGGVVLVPPAYRDACAGSLAATRRMCSEIMGLKLRCSLIPMAEIRKRGRDMLIGSHDLGSGRLLAMLAGGGVELAEQLCKSPEGAAFALAEGEGEADLTGLSCRWEPLRPAHGVVLSLVVQARGDASPLPAIYAVLYARIAQAVAADFSPSKHKAYRLHWPPSGMTLEAAVRGRQGRLRRAARIALETAVGMLSVGIGRSFGGFDGRAYLQSLPRHSDYRKYVNSLRMVIDCTPAQADAVVALLDAEWRNGSIDYGTHRTNAALMTCFVRNTKEGGHIHFIDGADGGYALAALEMKRRMAGRTPL